MVAFESQNQKTLIQMMTFKGRGSIQFGQGIVHLMLEGIIRTTMIKIVTDASNDEAQDFDLEYKNSFKMIILIDE